MLLLVCDSSSLVKRYVTETGTAWMVSLTDPGAGNWIYVAGITGVEIISAITRRHRRGDISAVEAQTAFADFRADLSSDYVPVDVTPDLIENAMALAQTHGLRGYDTVQLATALQVRFECAALGLPDITFLSADNELNAAAAAEGLTVDNPNAHP